MMGPRDALAGRCDSSRRICGANLPRNPLRAHRDEHDLGYLPRALSNLSGLTAGIPRIHVHRLVTALSRPKRGFEIPLSHHLFPICESLEFAGYPRSTLP